MDALAVEQITKHFDARDTAHMSALDKLAQKVNETAQEAKEASLQAAGANAELLSFKQRLVSRGGSGFGISDHKSIGQQFAEHDEVRAFRETRSRPSRVRLELATKTITSATGSGAATVVPARGATEMLARQELRIVDLLPTVTVTTGSIEYAKQSTRSLLAATVAEGALKPESDIAFTLTTVPIRTVAHWIGIARQVLEDSEQLRGLVDTELLFGVRLKEEKQEVVSGDGTGTHILGLIPSAAAFVAPITVPTPTSIDVLGTAILQVALANYMPNAIVIHPSDLARIRLQKDSTGRYIVSDNPAVGMPPSLFGVGLVPSLGISPDKFLVLDTQAAATVYRRTQPIVEASSEHSDFFVRNLVALLAESRLGLAVRNPTAMAYGDFGVIP